MLEIKWMMKKKYLVAGALSCSLLVNSCYFNSAGHIFDQASYRAGSTTTDVRTDGSQVVYQDSDGDYYIELPRYRVGKPVQTQYSAFSQKNESASTMQRKGEVDMYKIPKDFAMYLAGKANGPQTPSYMDRVSYGGWVKYSDDTIKMPIVRKPGEYTETWRYKSPNAFWLYSAGVLDWLCVDLPVTCVENALVVTYCALYIASRGTKSSSSGSSSSGSSSHSHDSDIVLGRDCVVCRGTGTFENKRCVSCSGSGEHTPCVGCNGEGKFGGIYTCAGCEGTGVNYWSLVIDNLNEER